MSFLRPLLAVLVVVGACWLSTNFSEHHEGTNENAFDLLYAHVVPHVLVEGHAEGAAEHGHAHALIAVPLPGFLSAFGHADFDGKLVATNLQIFQIAAVLLVLIIFSGVPGYLKTGRGDVLSGVAAGFCLWIRDEMVFPVMGKEMGTKFLPYFLSVFFFILFCNLMGLVPGSATATASIFVTGGLALTTFVSMLACGMAAQGPLAFWKNLVPHVPAWLWPLMLVVELMGLLVKPLALMIRLFANMTGGHLVVLSFMGLIFFFAGTDFSAAGWGIAPVAVGFAVFIMIIEGFVAMLQAYIFTQLSILFVHAAVHPEH